MLDEFHLNPFGLSITHAPHTSTLSPLSGNSTYLES